MPSQEKVHQILLSKEMSNTERRDQLHSLMPADVYKIDNLNKATPAQLKQLQEAIEITQALQQLNAEEFKQNQKRSREQPSSAQL
jgi:hypothetical protein